MHIKVSSMLIQRFIDREVTRSKKKHEVMSAALKSRPITSLYKICQKMAASGVPAEHDDYCLKEYKYLYSPDILSRKVAFISGGGSGIGFRIAELFMRHGCDTVIASRKMSKLEESAQTLVDATGRECLPVQTDVRKYDLVKNAVAAAIKKFGKIDILVNAAAGNFLCPASSLSSNGFRTVLEIDTIGTFNVTKAVYEQYFQDHGGVVINISATLHYNGKVFQTHAGSAKAAIDAMTRHLAVEWGPQNIRVNCLTPGPIEGTEGMRKLGGKNRTARDWLGSHIPLQRLGTRTEMAEAAIFLASPLSAYMTGGVLVVDGGSWMTDGRTLSAFSEVASKL